MPLNIRSINGVSIANDGTATSGGGATDAQAAAASAAEAALYDGPWVDDVAALLADTSLTYTAGQPGTLEVGDVVQTRIGGFAYEVVAASATPFNVQTAGAVRLSVFPKNGIYSIDALGVANPVRAQIDNLVATGATVIDLGGRTVRYDGASLPCNFVNGTVYTHANPFLLRRELPRRIGKVELPSELSWWAHAVYINADGSASTDFSFESIIPTPGVIKYVSAGGNTGNSGDHPAASWPSIEYAIANAGGTGDLKIILNGDGDKSIALQSSAVTPTRNIHITTLGETKFKIYSTDFGKSWSKTSGRTYVYEATSIANLEAGFPVSDFKFIDTLGDAATYPVVADVAACDALPGSCFYDSGAQTLYVHRLDGSAPTGNEVAFWRPQSFIFQNANFNIVLENIDFYGLPVVSRCTQTSSPTPPTIYARNCTFKYVQGAGPLGGGNLRSDGGHTVSVDCVFARGRRDGANYHGWNNSGTIINPPRNVEINCVGRDNGTTGAGNNQGSTTHDAGTLLRLNGTYARNEGENLSDVSTGTVSVSIGCKLEDSLKDTSPRHIAVGSGAQMYLANIAVSGRAEFDILTSGTGELKIFNSELPRYNGANGQAQPWELFD